MASHQKRTLQRGGQSKAKEGRWRAPVSNPLDDALAELALERAKNKALTEHISAGCGLPAFNQQGCTYDMDDPEAKQQLAADLWAPDYAPFMSKLRDENTVLAAILGEVVANTYRPTEERLEHAAFRRGSQMEGILASLSRDQSQKRVPFSTGALSVCSKTSEVPVGFTGPLAMLHRGTVCSPFWLKGLLDLAPTMRPVSTVSYIPGVEAAFFDNFTMRMMYGAYDTATDGAGIRQDMTNWGSLRGIPHHLSPTLNAAALFRAPTVFRTLSKAHFCNLFRLNHPEIITNKADRWVFFLRASQSGTLFSRPSYVSSWHADFVYYEPIWGCLQSKTEDVRIEINRIRRMFPHAKFIFVGGDGLSIMRINHLLNNEPETYLYSSPMCIPVQGEHPHGTFHVLHAGWRMYLPFLREALAVQLRNPMFKADPTVEDFNHVRFLLFVLVRACAEFVVEMSNSLGGVAFEDFNSFSRQAESNIDFAWVVHFLADFGFLLLDFQQAVRGNDSHKLDLLWREFYGLGHNDVANKTQYCPMAIMRVYWGQCLVQPLHDLYHAIRTIPSGFMPGTCVGWDMPIERLNGAIRRHVKTGITQRIIWAFIKSYTFLEHVRRTLMTYLHGGAHRMFQREHHTHRDIETDVRVLKDWLRQAVCGPPPAAHTWAFAARVNASPTVVSDRSRPPWQVQRDAMRSTTAARSYHAHVDRVVSGLAEWATWDD